MTKRSRADKQKRERWQIELLRHHESEEDKVLKSLGGDTEREILIKKLRYKNNYFLINKMLFELERIESTSVVDKTSFVVCDEQKEDGNAFD